MRTISKRFGPFPVVLRDYYKDNEESLLHAENLSIILDFHHDTVDALTFNTEFSMILDSIDHYLEEAFDTTILVEWSDPYRSQFEDVDDLGLADIRLVNDNSPSGLAKMIFDDLKGVVENNQYFQLLRVAVSNGWVVGETLAENKE